MSKSYEHTIANGIDTETTDEIRAFRIGFSGSSNKPNPDVLVTTPRDCYGMEIKRTKSSETFYVNGADIEQLTQCQNSYTSVWLVVKFTHREPVTIRYYDSVTGDNADDFNDKSSAEKMAALTPEAFDAHVTDGGNLALHRPSTDEWKSSQAGVSDTLAVLRDMGIENSNSFIV